jgi:hypothetical protein
MCAPAQGGGLARRPAARRLGAATGAKEQTRLREGNRVVYAIEHTVGPALGRSRSPADGPDEAGYGVWELACVEVGC